MIYIPTTHKYYTQLFNIITTSCHHIAQNIAYKFNLDPTQCTHISKAYIQSIQNKPLIYNKYTSRYAITFGENAILHVGGKTIGNGRRKHGYTVQELLDIQKSINTVDAPTTLFHINSPLPPSIRNKYNAAVLLIHNGANFILKQPDAADKLLHEQQHKVVYDKKFWNSRTKKTLHKRARFNIVFGPHNIKPSEDYQQYTVKSFNSLPMLQAFKNKLNIYFGKKALGLNAEGNHYYQLSSGIGFHGDEERKIVICLCLGQASILRYHWRLPGSSTHTLQPVDIPVKHGDIYIMSEKATGWDWKLRSTVRVVHAAGHHKYINK